MVLNTLHLSVCIGVNLLTLNDLLSLPGEARVNHDAEIKAKRMKRLHV